MFPGFVSRFCSSDDPISSDSFSLNLIWLKHLIKKLIQPRHLEYLKVNESLQILDMSIGVKSFADDPDPDEVKIGNDIRLGFPELFCLEEILQQVIEERQDNFELKGITRFDDPQQPLYIDL
ncbi:hypothetical protein AM228_16805 [Planktothricoides sp. SR001]|nr:hypothetical protein AM228_16805 [Planktothricoides sp. SR001]